MAQTVNVTDVLAERKFGPFHIGILALCGIAMFADGFDTQIMGYVAPNMTRSLELGRGALGPVLSWGGAGIMLGSLFIAPIADYIGRKRIIVLCLWTFAAFSFATSLATTVGQLMWLRLLTGIALGGLTPNALALATEYMPVKNRTARVTFVWVGYSLGSTLAGPGANLVLANWEWPAVFVACGILPVIAALIVMPMLPESAMYLVRKGAAPERIAAVLRRAAPGIPPAERYILTERNQSTFPVVSLFTEGRAAMTALVWVVYFMNLSMIYFMNAWLPTILNESGLSEAAANNVSAVAHVAGIVGGLVIAVVADKWSKFGALAAASVCSALLTLAMGAAGAGTFSSLMAVTVAVSVATLTAGFFVFGVQNTVNAIAPSLYPTALRSMGAGWATGVGRFSAITSPYVGGLLLELNWPASRILYIVAVPAFLSSLAAMGLRIVTNDRSAAPDDAARRQGERAGN